jgi:hypothetical protein
MYHIGKRIEFRAPLGKIKNGTMGVITDVGKDYVTVKTDRGERVHLASTSDPFSKQRSWDKYVAFEITKEPLAKDRVKRIREKAFQEATLPLDNPSTGDHVVYMDSKLDIHIATIVRPDKGDRVEIEEQSGMRVTVSTSILRKPKGRNLRHNMLEVLAGEGNPNRGEGGRYTSGGDAGGKADKKMVYPKGSGPNGSWTPEDRKKVTIEHISSRVKEIQAMDPDERDNMEFRGAVDHPAYLEYEAAKLLPKPVDKLKKVNTNNSFALWQDAEYIANVEGKFFAVSKEQDPDAPEDEGEDGSPKSYIYSVRSLHDQDGISLDTSTNDVEELFADIRHAMKKPKTNSFHSLTSG